MRRKAQRQRRLRQITLIFILAVFMAFSLSVHSGGSTESSLETSAPPEAEPVSAAYNIETAEESATDVDPSTVEIIAKAVYGEAGVCSATERAAVVWCICNRVDAGYGNLAEVTTASGQFYGYDEDNPVEPEIEALVRDVLLRWQTEDGCIGSTGRVLPKEYLWFTGDGVHNYYRNEYLGGTQWDWSLPSPYGED
jgi:hypothetical protein